MAAVLNVPVTGAAGSCYVMVFPCRQAPPNTSNLNYIAGDTIPNAVIAPIGSAAGFASSPTPVLICSSTSTTTS